MPLQEILERNRLYVRGRTPQPLPPPDLVRLVILACYDPRLDPLLRPALGLGEQRAFVIRSAGAIVAPAGDPLRSIALAVGLFDATEVLVVGHTSCRMAAFDESRFTQAFRRRGVAREAFGPGDLRAWAGAIPDPHRGVLASVATLRATPFLPKDLTVAGVVLEDTTGALETVIAPGDPAGTS